MPAAADRSIGRMAGIAAIVIYLAVGVVPYAASGLLAPAMGIVVLYAGWVIGLWITFRLFQNRSFWSLAMPPAALVYWWTVLTLGESLLGWTA